MLPPRIAKKPKRDTRWRSQAHCNFIRSHACCACGDTAGIQVAHVRIGSGAGMGQKPSDWHTISLCDACHAHQHSMGEKSFENAFKINMQELASEFASASPRASEIRRIKQERELG